MLVIDDLSLRPLDSNQAADMVEVIEDRTGLRSTTFTSQPPIALWQGALGDPPIARLRWTACSRSWTSSSSRASRCANQNRHVRRERPLSPMPDNRCHDDQATPPGYLLVDVRHRRDETAKEVTERSELDPSSATGRPPAGGVRNRRTGCLEMPE